MNNPPRNEELVAILRDVAKLHRITYQDLATVSGIPLGTLGGVLSGFQKLTQERLAPVWKACQICMAEKVLAQRQSHAAALEELRKVRKELATIKERVQQALS